MIEGIKSSLLRARQILSVNLVKFSLAAMFTVLVLLVVAGVRLFLGVNLLDDAFSRTALQILVVLFFIIPFVSHGMYLISSKARGVIEVKINPQVMKTGLFVAAGVLWASLGGLLIALTVDQYGALKFIASLASLVSWWFICRTLIVYVKSV